MYILIVQKLLTLYRSYRYAPVILTAIIILFGGAITVGALRAASILGEDRADDTTTAADIPFAGEVPYGFSSTSYDNRETDEKNSSTQSTNGGPEGSGSGTNGSTKANGSTPTGSAAAPRGQSPAAPTSISLRATIPQSGTVLTLSGLNFNLYNYMPRAFGGIFNKSPYTMRKITYPASLASDSISKGVSELNAAVRSTPGQKIVMGHSQGAQVASHWMRQYTNDPTAPKPSELTFILTGNPLRSTGGYIIGRPEVGGTTGQPTPTNTKWTIVDVTRRYDGWADWVKDTNNQWAVDNANAGKSSFHSRYDQVDLYNPAHTVWKSGNTVYVLTKESDLPLWKDNSAYPLSVQSAMRAQIERAYTRPSNDPVTMILPIDSAYWQDQLRSWGVPF